MAVEDSGRQLDPNQLRLLAEEMHERLARQRDDWDHLEQKTTTILAATGVVLGLVVDKAGNLTTYPVPALSLYVTALVALVVALGLGVLAMWPRELKDVPDPTALLGYARQTMDHTLGTLLSTRRDAFAWNERRMGDKVSFVRGQMVAFAVAGLLLTVVVVVGVGR